jgi:predicted TIM-barrel fold metal-dependent hydrolase
VQFVLDHFGSPVDVAKEEAVYAQWKNDMTALSALPNVYCKISGLMPVLGFDYAARRKEGKGPDGKEIAASRFGEMVRMTLQMFGAERCMFGSNFPVVSVFFG